VQAKADENLTNRNLLSSSCDRSYLVAISSSSVEANKAAKPAEALEEKSPLWYFPIQIEM